MTARESSLSHRVFKSHWFWLGRFEVVLTIGMWGLGGGAFVHHTAGRTFAISLGPLTILRCAHPGEGTPL